MNFISVSSGIEAASAAWHPLGWKAIAYSEIDPFACWVLHSHFGCGRPHFMPDPDEEGLSEEDANSRRLAIAAVADLPLVPYGSGIAPNLGDMTRFKEWPIERGTADLLVGGTPCQSFSIAGLREGLEDPRGNLMLTFGAIADHFAIPRVVWENVPGVLSSNRGRDFAAFLGMLGKLGYGFAYRVLDAQYFGVPQRRRRVFVVGYLGDWRRAAAVLFESHSLQGHSPPSRETGKDASRGSTFGIDEECNATEDGFSPLLRGGQGGTRPAVAQGVESVEYYESHPQDSRVTGPHEVGETVAAKYGTGGGEHSSGSAYAEGKRL